MNSSNGLYCSTAWTGNLSWTLVRIWCADSFGTCVAEALDEYQCRECPGCPCHVNQASWRHYRILRAILTCLDHRDTPKRRHVPLQNESVQKQRL
jgi:hypothetical protein